MEALGILLGVLPLLVSALEHYEDVLRPVRRYGQYTCKAQKFCDELETERAIFYAECQLILEVVTERREAIKMLEDLQHPLWKSAVLSRKLDREFGTLGKPCMTTITNINEKLIELDKNSKGLNVDLAQPNIESKREWVRLQRRKLKFAFSAVSLKATIEELRALNKTFLTISSQIMRIKSRELDTERQPSSVGPRGNEYEGITRFKIIRTASQLLYESLERACSVHREHLAMLCLVPSCIDPVPGIEPHHIRFTMAITPFLETFDPIDSSVTNQSITEIPIVTENAIEISAEAETPNSQLGSSRSSSSSLSESRTWLEIETIIRSQDLSGKQPQHTSVDTSELSASSPVIQKNLPMVTGNHIRIHEDLCVRLQVHITEAETSVPRHMKVVGSASDPGSYVGTIGDNETCRHHLYCISKSEFTHKFEQQVTLAELITPDISGSPVGGLPQFQRLCIAKSLALAVLQYHTTPWLAGTWQSNNIVLREITSSNLQNPIPPLYLSVRVSKSLQLRESAVDASISSRASKVLPNPLLFALGIMLLEIAYSSSFESLLEPQDYEVSPDTRLINFHAAQRLASNVGIYLGAGFANIIRQCLRCDFGCGEDLGNPELQARVYNDVVYRLESLEEGFRKLQVNG